MSHLVYIDIMSRDRRLQLDAESCTFWDIYQNPNYKLDFFWWKIKIQSFDWFFVILVIVIFPVK